MKKSNLIAITALIIAGLTLNFCQEPERETGNVQFIFNHQSDVSSSGRVEEEILSKIIISAESIEGGFSVTDHEILISKFGNGYTSDPFLLQIGAYKITKFLVLDNNNEIAYATPRIGSALAGLVNNPLPVNFQISSDQITEVNLEVIETSSYDPEDLGYSSFSFSIIQTQDILISVLSQDAMGAYTFIESSLTVFDDGDSAFSITLGDSINVVRVRSDVEELLLNFSTSIHGSKQFTLTSDTLDYYRKVPLTVLFKDTVDLTAGLIAYYPFNGNANDGSGNDLNGTVNGAILTTDRNANSNSAYEFTGNDDVITVAHNDLLNIVDSLTLSVWINLYSSNQWGSRIIDKVERGSAIGYLVDIYNLDNTSSSFIESVRFIGREGFTNTSEEEVTLNEWNHIAVSYASGEVNIYLNGTLISTTTETETQLLTNTEMLEIGNDKNGAGQDLYDPFRGKIDEVRIYNRVLSSEEIDVLATF